MTRSPPDLVRRHGYVTDTFPRLATRGDAARFELGADRLREFHERGFVAAIDVLDRRQAGEIGERVERLRERAAELDDRIYEIEAAWTERPEDVVFHCLGGWMVDELLHDMVFHPAVTVPCAQCLGTGRLRFWHDQVFTKPPRHAACVPWHQDYSYWTRTAPAAHVTMHIALDDADEENGCIHYVPGSHEWGLWDKVAFGGDMDAFVEALPEERRARFAPVPVRLRAGQGVVHHSHTIHGSWPNRTDRPRRALVLNYIADGVRVAEPGPLLRGVPEIAVGEPVRGDWFPVTLDRADLSR